MPVRQPLSCRQLRGGSIESPGRFRVSLECRQGLGQAQADAQFGVAYRGASLVHDLWDLRGIAANLEIDNNQIDQTPRFKLPQRRLGRNGSREEILRRFPIRLRIQHLGIEQLETQNPIGIGLLLGAR